MKRLRWKGKLPRTFDLPIPFGVNSEREGQASTDENGEVNLPDGSADWLLANVPDLVEVVGDAPRAVARATDAADETQEPSVRTVYSSLGMATIQRDRRFPGGTVVQRDDGRFEIVPAASEEG